MEDTKVVYLGGSKKGIYTGHSVTVIKGQKEKYGYTLQEVNDRICSYRPNVSKEEVSRGKWDGATYDYGLYTSYQSDDPNDSVDAKLFKDFKILAKSAAGMRGYLNINKVRGGTPQDVDDFLNFVVIKLMERRLKQFDPTSSCRELDNWPSYLARVIPQYLILFNKSKIDYEVEAFWPMVKDEKSGEYVPKDFGIEPVFQSELVSREGFLKLYERVVGNIPESKGLEVDILMQILYGISFSHKNLVARMAEIVKLQLFELKGEIILEL